MSSTIKIVKFHTFSEFVSEFPKFLFVDGIFRRDQYLFRGHGSEDFKLRSSFDRRFLHLSVVDRVARFMELEEYLMEEFSRIGFKDGDKNEVLGLAQHYGTPTRLLDWTSSPLVAAYFAFNNRINIGSGAKSVSVWALDRAVKETWSRLGVEILRLEQGRNFRADRQLGYATLIRTPDDTLEDFALRVGGPDVVLWRFDIDSSQAREAFSFLDACNARATELFGKEEGAARTALERLALRFGV